MRHRHAARGSYTHSLTHSCRDAEELHILHLRPARDTVSPSVESAKNNNKTKQHSLNRQKSGLLLLLLLRISSGCVSLSSTKAKFRVAYIHRENSPRSPRARPHTHIPEARKQTQQHTNKQTNTSHDSKATLERSFQPPLYC